MTLDELTFGGPFRIAQLRYVKDDGGHHRECRSPGADLSDLPKNVQARIEAEWTPEVIAAYREATKEVPAEPEPPPPPDPIRAELDALKARIAALEATKVDINDRGPFTGGRCIDLSAGAADAIGMTKAGIGNVSITRVR